TPQLHLGLVAVQLQSAHWPRTTEAWLNFASIAPAAGKSPAAAVASAFAAGARVVRTAVPAGDDPAIAACRAAGFACAARWRIISGVQPAQFNLTAAGKLDAVWRARRFSAGQWRNPRVRLAVQATVEAAAKRLGLAPAD